MRLRGFESRLPLTQKKTSREVFFVRSCRNSFSVLRLGKVVCVMRATPNQNKKGSESFSGPFAYLISDYF